MKWITLVFSLVTLATAAIFPAVIIRIVRRFTHSMGNRAGETLDAFVDSAVVQLDHALDRRFGDPETLRQLQQRDPLFSAAELEARVANWASLFQQCWQKGDLLPCRHFFSDSLYHEHVRQLKQRGPGADAGAFAVTHCKVNCWRQEGDRELLDVGLKVLFRRPGRETQRHYIWQLMRTAGGQTRQNAGLRVEECPNCGAQTNANQSGQCAYCGSTVLAEDFDWVLHKIDKIGQKNVASSRRDA